MFNVSVYCPCDVVWASAIINIPGNRTEREAMMDGGGERAIGSLKEAER